MFCKPEVKLILESLWAERENGKAEIRLATVVTQRISAESKKGVFANSITRLGHTLTAHNTCATISVHWTTTGLSAESNYREGRPLFIFSFNVSMLKTSLGVRGSGEQ